MPKKKPSGSSSAVTSKATSGNSSRGVVKKLSPPALPPAVPRASKSVVVVDFPLEGEIVTTPHYTFRIGCSATAPLEICVDGREWAPCRASVGYWWYDWSASESGAHTVVARMKTGRRSVESRPRRFTVLI